jgi:hypothetical protein
MPDQAVLEDDQSLINVPVVVGVELQHLLPAGVRPRQPDTVGDRLTRRKRELPPQRSEPAREFLGDPDRILDRELEGASAPGLARDRLDHRLGRMPAKGARDTQHHVQIAAPIDICEVSTRALFHIDRRMVIVRPEPSVRHTLRHPGPPPGEKLSRTRPLRHETLILCRLQGPHPVQIKKASATPCHTRPPESPRVRWRLPFLEG